MFAVKIIFLIIYLFFLVKIILKKESTYMPFWILPLFMFAWKGFSLLYLEQGVYATELYRKTYPIGTEYVFIILMTIFFAAAIASVKIFDNALYTDGKETLVPRRNLKITWFVYFHVILLMYLYLNVFLTGIYFPRSILIYINHSRLPFVNTLGSTVMFFLLTIDGVSAFLLKKHKALIAVIILLSIGYMIIIGQKFSGIYQYVIFFITPFIFNYALTKKLTIRVLLRPKVLITIAIIIGVFAVYSMFKYDSTGSSKSSAEQLFIARLFDMQSGTLWGVNDFAIKNHSEWFGVSAQRNLELQGWIENWSDLDDRIGLGKVMKLVTLNEISSDYLASGLRFSGWFLVVSILNFGYFGSAILCVLLGLIFAIITVAMKKALLKGDILIIAVAVFSYCHFYDYYRIGNFNILFSIPGILCLIILSVYLYGRRKRVRG